MCYIEPPNYYYSCYRFFYKSMDWHFLDNIFILKYRYVSINDGDTFPEAQC